MLIQQPKSTNFYEAFDSAVFLFVLLRFPQYGNKLPILFSDFIPLKYFIIGNFFKFWIVFNLSLVISYVRLSNCMTYLYNFVHFLLASTSLLNNSVTMTNLTCRDDQHIKKEISKRSQGEMFFMSLCYYRQIHLTYNS